ncbi:MAG: HAD-IIIC family phosphatase [Chloroflexota bacterium]|nr:HAD-IIIC family phosphatase [Chloroflexota bacterium]
MAGSAVRALDVAQAGAAEASAPVPVVSTVRRLLANEPEKAYGMLLKAKQESSFTNLVTVAHLLKRVPWAVRQTASVATLRLAVLGNSTLDQVADALLMELAPRIACEVYVGGFDQWALEMIAADSPLAVFNADVIVLHLSALGLTRGGSDLSDRDVAGQLRQALDAFHQHNRHSIIVVVLPEPLEECTGANSEADRWYDRISGELQARLRGWSPERLVLLDPMAALRAGGQWLDARLWNSAKMPFSSGGCVAVGRRLAQIVENATYPRVKAVAVDFDDTVWGGVAGEVGPEGLALSPFDQGAAYLRLQRLLKEASANGIVLVGLSKNELATVEAVFRTRSEMVLSLDDFSAMKVNWEPKSQNLIEASTELNLGLDAFLLVDDSPYERAEVRAALPEVMVPELPVNAEEYAGFVASLGLLERPLVREEDRQRTGLYRQEQKRQRIALTTVSRDEFLRGLQLQVVAARISERNADRVYQLVSKTNQLNLTTRRHSKGDLLALAGDPAVYAYCFRVVDVVGDAGLAAVCIACPADLRLAIDSFLLSCRVMGRTVENAIFEHLRHWTLSHGHRELRAQYIKTKKNGPAADLLPRLGFALMSASEEVQSYVYTDLQCDFGNGFARLVEEA